MLKSEEIPSAPIWLPLSDNFKEMRFNSRLNADAIDVEPYFPI